MVRLLSVPHTGTRFMVQVLENAGYRKTHSLWGGGDFIQVHFDGKGTNPLIYENKELVIIPLRDRQEVEDSWRRRNRSIRELESMWAEMESFIQSYDEHIYIIHIDDPNRRNDELYALTERLGTPLIADFKVKVGQGK